MSATSEIVWCGDRNGLFVIRAVWSSIFPATECIFVVSKASSSVRGGIIVGNLLANIVLPAPGGPIIIKLYAVLKQFNKSALNLDIT
jgi:hypothetical protein